MHTVSKGILREFKSTKKERERVHECKSVDGNKKELDKSGFYLFSFSSVFFFFIGWGKENKATITTKKEERFVPKKEVRTHNMKRPFVSESKQQQKQQQQQ